MKLYSLAGAVLFAVLAINGVSCGACVQKKEVAAEKTEYIVCAHETEEIGGNDEQYDGQLAVPAHISLDRITLVSDVCPPLESARVTSLFGYRKNPVTGKFTFHSGYDLAAASGSEIYAMLSGTVSTAKWDDGYGNYLIIDHNDGTQTLYAHCSELIAQKGDYVEKGEVVAKVGSTGNSTGPHLHVEFRQNGKRYDPEWVLGGMYS